MSRRFALRHSRYLWVGVPVISWLFLLLATPVRQPPEGVVEPPPAVVLYVDDALDFIEQTAVVSRRVDWRALRREIMIRASDASTPEDAYPIIVDALHMTGDRHGFLVVPHYTSEEVAESPFYALNLDALLPEGRRLDGDIGYLLLPELQPDQQFGLRYSSFATDLIRMVDREPTCGWIVDLRNDSGGNMWPMIAGIGPLLENGVVGAFVDKSGRSFNWTYVDGTVSLDDRIIAQGTPYNLKVANPPVAVLIGHGTASSGEAIAIALNGLENTRTFGHDSYGVPTALSSTQLADGARLFVSSAAMADRNGRLHIGAIAPDVEVGEFSTSLPHDRDPVVRAAAAWLSDQNSCR